MKFYVQSVKTKQFLYGRYAHHDEWGDFNSARNSFKNIQDAYNAAKRCSRTSRAKVVLFDGISFWNITPSRI